jgi:hypothetical protein
LTTWKQKRAKIAGLSRVLPHDDPKLVEVRRDLKAQRLEEHVAKVVAAAPPLSAEQRDRIAAILRGSGGDPA